MPETLPLLHKQERRLIGEELRRRATGDARSMAQFAMVLAAEKPVDRIALTRALNAAVARHAALRTVIVPSLRYSEAARQMHLQTFARTRLYIPGLYEQRPLAQAEVELCERTWSGDHEELDAITRAECAILLDLSSAPLLRATVVAGEHRQLVIVNLSHLMLDQWAGGLLYHDVAHAYSTFLAGAPLELPAVRQQHDLVTEELAMLQSPEGEGHLAYWSAHYGALDDAPIKARELPFVNSPAGPARFEVLRVSLSRDEVRQVHEACGGMPDYAFWRTMYGMALGMLVNKTRVAFWANFLNRRRPGEQHVVAWCAHAHMLAVDAPWSLPWVDVWREVRRGVREAQAHERYSWDSVALRLARPIGIVDTQLTFDVVPAQAVPADAPLQPLSVPGAAMPADLGIRVHLENPTYSLVATFNSARYSVDGVGRLVTLLHETIRMCATQPAAKVGDIVGTVRQRQRPISRR